MFRRHLYWGSAWTRRRMSRTSSWLPSSAGRCRAAAFLVVNSLICATFLLLETATPLDRGRQPQAAG